MDPARRDYGAIFDELLRAKVELVAANFSLVLQVQRSGFVLGASCVVACMAVHMSSSQLNASPDTLQGKGGGRRGASTLEVPEELLQLGLVRVHHAVPFQEYYDILHGCIAVLPAFASDAYYVDKGSSSIGTAIIAGTPLIATPKLLEAYRCAVVGVMR